MVHSEQIPYMVKSNDGVRKSSDIGPRRAKQQLCLYIFQ